MFPNLVPDVSVRLIIPVALAMLAGCTLAPAYERPTVALPASFGQMRVDAPVDARAPAVLTEREQAFVHALSPERDLVPLVGRALAHNADYRMAAMQVEQARALYRVERAAQFPAVGVNVQGTKRHFDNAALNERYQQNLVLAGVGIEDFELDFFGRLQSLSKAARERYLASDAGREAARGALIAEVLRAYTLDCAATAQREHLQAVDADSAALLMIARRQVEVGLLPADDLDRRQAQADRAHASALQAADDARAARRALQALVGFDADVPPTALAHLAQVPAMSQTLRDLDSQLLLQRPDIRQAEAQLRAAHADIGAARAAFFPSIRLSTSLGSASSSLDGLFGNGSRTWSFMPQLVLPVFDFGRNRANLDLAWTRQQAGVAEYEKAVETAFREVADALDARASLDEIETRLARQDGLAALRIERHTDRVARGLADRQDLIADRIDAAQITFDHLQAQRALALNRIALFRAFYGVDLSPIF